MENDDFKRVSVKRFPSKGPAATPEGRYWRRFKNPILLTHHGAVSHIDFSPVAPHHYAVTASTRVAIYDGKTNRERKAIGRIKDVAYSGSFRRDGKLIVAGSADFSVSVFDVQSRSKLRHFKGHGSAIHSTKFSLHKQVVLSGSDDKTCKLWDLATAECVATLSGHTDYVRGVCPCPDEADVWATAGYDNTVRLWDTRSGQCEVTLDHGAPVEAILYFPNGRLLASAGGKVVKVWDLSSDAAIATLCNHRKTVTSLTIDAQGGRLLSGSADHLVKIYDVNDFGVKHTIKYPAPILSIGLSPDDTRIAVGMADGQFCVRTRIVKAKDAAKRNVRGFLPPASVHEIFGRAYGGTAPTPAMGTAKDDDFDADAFGGDGLEDAMMAGMPMGYGPKRGLRRGTKRFRERGKSEGPGADDYKIMRVRRAKLRPYDKMLKAFRYGAALDAAIKLGDASVILSVIEELVSRGGLMTSLSNRDEESLQPLVLFLVKNICNPKYAARLLEVGEAVLDIYAPVITHSAQISTLFANLRERVRAEVQFQCDLMELQGMVEMVLGTA